MTRLLLLLCVLLVVPSGVRAAETDNYWGFYVTPRDSTWQLERHLQQQMERSLDEINALPGSHRLACHDVSAVLMMPFSFTGVWFFVGTMDGLGLYYTPRSNSEYQERYRPVSIYRYADRPFPGVLLPLDPITRIAGVNVGLDKLGHFLLNGRRYYERYLKARRAGKSEEEALISAIELGIAQEDGILGLAVSSIFSYADLEANYQGLELHRWLCEGESPALVLKEERWTLQEPFSLERFVNPCWDESFMPNAYEEMGSDVRRALEEICPLLDEPHVRRLRASYKERGCQSFSHRYLMQQVDEGALPDPWPYDVDAVCGAAPGQLDR